MNNRENSVLNANASNDFREPKVYSTTGFKDTLASPMFYSVAVVSLVLGAVSIFGFLQNPLKLKAVAHAIHNKVSISSPVSSSSRNLYSLSQSLENQNHTKQKNHATILFYEPQQEEYNKAAFNKASFNYDVTANDFWTDLDTTRLESAVEEIQRQDLEATLIGAPLESDYHQQLESELMPLNDSIYSLSVPTNSI